MLIQNRNSSYKKNGISNNSVTWLCFKRTKTFKNSKEIFFKVKTRLERMKFKKDWNKKRICKWNSLCKKI